MAKQRFLHADMFSPQRLLQQGRPKDFYNAQRLSYNAVKIERLDLREAVLSVRVNTKLAHEVEIWLEDDELQYDCSCDRMADDPEHMCAHLMAAGLTLRNYLYAHPFQTWQTLLDRSLQGGRGRQAGRGKHLLCFSLQSAGQSRGLFLYSVAVEAVPEELLDDGPALARHLAAQAKTIEPKAVTSNVTPASFYNMTPQLAAAVKVMSSFVSPYQGYYGMTSYEYSNSGLASALDVIMPLLEHAPLCAGTDRYPLSKPLTVLQEQAQVAAFLEPEQAALRLDLRFDVAGETLKAQEVKPLFPGVRWLYAAKRQLIFRLMPQSEPFLPLLDKGALTIPADEQEEFLGSYLPRLAKKVTIRSDTLRIEDVAAAPTPRVYLKEEQGSLSAELRFGYGEVELAVERNVPEQSVVVEEGGTRMLRVRRDLEREEEALRGLSGHKLKRGQPWGSFELRANAQPLDFLLHEVPKLTGAGYEIYGEEALKLARVNRNPPRISFNVSSGLDWFDLEATVSFGDQHVPWKSLRRAIRKRERYIKLADGSIGAIPDDWIERYRHLLGLAEETDAGMRVSLHHLTLLDQLLGDQELSGADEELRRRREQLRDFAGIAHTPLPARFQGELRHYQEAAYDWLHFLHSYGFGGCLADDMGTGKTITTLAFLSSLREGHAQRADLIVLPRSLVFNWQREAERFTPHLRVLRHVDQDRAADPSVFDQYDLVLTTYGVMRNDVELLRQYQFHYLILDESQAIKNPVAETSKAARLLRGEHRLCLTGTPVENSSAELWSQFAFLNPGLLGSLDYFREEFVLPVERKSDAQAAELLKKLVYPFILRRTKDQVAPELPPRSERVLECEMEPAQRQLYNRQRDYYRELLLGMIEDEGIDSTRMKILEGLLRLRQICNHPRLIEPASAVESAKFELLLETLETLQAEGHKALIFSQFVTMLKLVRDELDRRKVPYLYLDGRTRDRQARVDAFQNDPSVPFFLISLKAGGVGLNLTEADYVIHIDPWWNPAVEAQASDRAHRIGQQRPVFIYKLIVKDTVEEKILQLQERKRALVAQLITTESGVLKGLTPQDVEVLFT